MRAGSYGLGRRQAARTGRGDSLFAVLILHKHENVRPVLFGVSRAQDFAERASLGYFLLVFKVPGKSLMCVAAHLFHGIADSNTTGHVWKVCA